MLVEGGIYLHCSICVSPEADVMVLFLVLVADAVQRAANHMQLQSCCVFV